MKQEANTVGIIEAESRFALEQERTQQLLQGIREIAPKRVGYQSIDYYSRTLMGKIRGYPSGQPCYSFITSLEHLLKEDNGERMHVNLDRKDSGDNYLQIGAPSELTLGISINRKKEAMVRLHARAFSYEPIPANLMLFSYRDAPDGLINQIYANSVLELLKDDLADNKANWEKAVQEKREGNFEMIRGAIGKERFWVIGNSLKGIAQVAGDEEHMVFAPDVMKNVEGSKRVVLYTTATLKEEFADKFSIAVSGGYSRDYPTEYRSSNDPGAKPLMVTPISDDLTVEIRGIKRPYYGQKQALMSAFDGYMYGREDALTFTHFPPNTPSGVKTTLVAVNPPLPVF